MTYFVIPICNGENMTAIELQNCRIENNTLYADNVRIGKNIDINGYMIKHGDVVIATGEHIIKPWMGNFPNYFTWLNWSDNGVCSL